MSIVTTVVEAAKENPIAAAAIGVAAVAVIGGGVYYAVGRKDRKAAKAEAAAKREGERINALINGGYVAAIPAQAKVVEVAGS